MFSFYFQMKFPTLQESLSILIKYSTREIRKSTTQLIYFYVFDYCLFIIKNEIDTGYLKACFEDFPTNSNDVFNCMPLVHSWI